MMRLRAEMKVPGRAWLQFEVTSRPDGTSLLEQTAYFAPLGLSGVAYWYLLYSAHAVIFRGLARQIARLSEWSGRPAGPRGGRAPGLPPAPPSA
jgi:hypothetical protein